MGKLLFTFGTYSCIVVFLTIFGVLISVFELEFYGWFEKFIDPLYPTILIIMLVVEGLNIVLLGFFYFKKSDHKYNDSFWKVGRLETVFVAIILFLFYAASFILPAPPS